MKILVVKYGSSSVAGANGIDQVKVNQYATKLLALKEFKLVIVSSGSVVAGKKIAKQQGNSGLTDTQYATLGTADSFFAWKQAFEKHGIMTAQLLVTHREINELGTGKHLLRTLVANLKSSIVTVINENDALSDEEMAHLSYGGDNDGLASRIAVALSCDRLMLLTDVSGILRADDSVFKIINPKQREYVDTLVINDVSKWGRGGAASKLTAAYFAADAGITSTISGADSDYQAVLLGEEGTTVLSYRDKS